VYRVPTSSTVIHFERTYEIAGFVFSRADIGLLAIDDQSGQLYTVAAIGIGMGCLAPVSKPGVVQVLTLTPGATVTPDLLGAGACFFTLTIDRDSVIANPLNATLGAQFWLKFVQGPGAPWAPSFGDAYRHQSGGFVPGAVEQGRSDTIGYVWNGTAADEFSRAMDVGA